jgi:molecular chaperone Hsp33
MIKKKIDDATVLEQLERLPEDSRYIYTLDEGKFRLTAVQCTTMVNQVRANFGLGFLETWVLGQAYIAGGLLASEVKGNDRITLSVQCGGPIKGFTVEAWACGAVRGYLHDAPIKLDKPLEGNDLNMLYGPGFLSITKMIEGSKTPFQGDVMMEYGDLAKDLALYYQQSEQTPTVFSLSLKFDKEGRLMGAGGFFVQVLPNCPEDDLKRLEALLPRLPYVGKSISQGTDMKEYVAEVFSEFHPEFLSAAPVGFSCPCTRGHFLAHLKGLAQDEKDSILKDDKYPVTVSCVNCGTDYSFSKEELFGEGK